MTIDLRQLYDSLGRVIDFNYEIDKAFLAEYGELDFFTTLVVKGYIMNKSGVISLKLSADYGLRHICDRCLVPFERNYSFNMDVVVVSSRDDYDERYIESDGDKLNVDEQVLSYLLLHFPSKVLCKEECKGLCQICGADLNEKDCGCQG